MSKVKVAVLGVGFVGGSAHAPSFKNIEDSELLAVCDTNKERAKEISGKYDTDYYTDYDELLEVGELDAVVLSIPTPLHYNFSMKALESGKNVLCEMPIAPEVEQAKELGERAQDKGKILMPCLNFRFAPIYNRVKEMIREGRIGEPVSIHYREFIRFHRLVRQWPAGSWAWAIEESGVYPDFTLAVWSWPCFPGCSIPK